MKLSPLSIIIILVGVFAASLTLFVDVKDITGGWRTKTGGGVSTVEIQKNRLEFSVSAERLSNNYIKGNPSAPIKIVEFSDIECKFCHDLHNTLTKLLQDYPRTVQWEFRHLPLITNINAREAALATECVGRLSGNDSFWKYIDYLYANQSLLHPDLYLPKALEYGVDEQQFNLCRTSIEMSEVLLSDEQIAMALGAVGSPFVVVVYPDGTQKAYSGALPYETWESIIINE